MLSYIDGILVTASLHSLAGLGVYWRYALEQPDKMRDDLVNSVMIIGGSLILSMMWPLLLCGEAIGLTFFILNWLCF
jgi:hypothetical protein